MKLPQPLRGVIPPVVTPLLNDDELDREGFERLIEHLLAGGVHGLFVLGTTGEGPSLSYRLRREVIRETIRLVRGRVPVLVGITDTAFVESLTLAQDAADAGAQAVVAASPYYFPTGQPELVEYVERLARAVPLPLFLYNMPGCTKTALEVSFVDRALQLPNIVGLKDSSGSMAYFHQLRQVTASRSDFTLLVGPEELLAEAVLLGGHGGVCGGANICPELYVKLYQAAAEADLSTLRHLHQRVIDLSSSVYNVGSHASGVIKGIKCALHCMGICSEVMAQPFHHFHLQERALVHQHLQHLGLLELQSYAQDVVVDDD